MLDMKYVNMLHLHHTMDIQVSEGMAISPRPIKSEKLSIGTRDRLTKKQSSFVDHYMQGNSPHKAALLAGYSPFTAEVATTLILNHPRVIAEIRRRSDEVFKEKKIDRNWVLQRAAELADANILDYLEIDENNGYAKVDMRRVSRAMGAAIQEVSYDPEGRLKIRLVDRKAAVELLARINKMFNETDDHHHGADTPLTIQALDQIVQNVTINQQVNVIHHQERQQLPDVVLDAQ